MFVETKKDGEAEAQYPSLAGFIAWLEKQPADEGYNWCIGSVCACGKYAESLGLRSSWLSRGAEADEHFRTWRSLNKIARGNSWGAENWTFGRALERARDALMPF